MSSFYSFYPPVGAGGNVSVGPNGTIAPTSSTEVGGINPSGNLQPLQTDATGALIVTPETGSVQHVIVDSSALPTGAATSANQVTAEATLTAIEANQTNGTQETQIVGTVPLPTGAATVAQQILQTSDLDALNARLPGGLVPVHFDENVLTYVGTTTQISTVVYKLASVTVKTLTLTYDSNVPPRIIDVVAT